MTRGGRIVVILLLVGAAVAMGAVAALDHVIARRFAAVAGAMPPGWMDVLRGRAMPPASARMLAPLRQDAADGSAIVYDTVKGAWDRVALDSVIPHWDAGKSTVGDSLAWDEVLNDPSLDRWARAAAAARWDMLPRVVAHSREGAEHDIFLLQPAHFRRVLSAGRALALRARLRFGRGARADARADGAAVLGLGLQVVDGDPTPEGFISGRALVHEGSLVLQRIGDATRDTLLARRSAEAAAWSESSTAQGWFIFAAAPDSALALARDSSLGMGFRAAAMAGAIGGPLLRPRGLLAGPPRRVLDALDTLAVAADGRARPLAALAARTAHWANHLDPISRWTRIADPTRRL
jgi:hypothetical protein